jgi:phosphoribosylformylglycinamidine cyclo-ligase
LPEGVGAVVRERSWPVHAIFRLIEKTGNVPLSDMKRTFNMGIGCIIVIPENEAGDAVGLLTHAGFDSYVIGSVVKGKKEVRYE